MTASLIQIETELSGAEAEGDIRFDCHPHDLSGIRMKSAGDIQGIDRLLLSVDPLNRGGVFPLQRSGKADSEQAVNQIVGSRCAIRIQRLLNPDRRSLTLHLLQQFQISFSVRRERIQTCRKSDRTAVVVVHHQIARGHQSVASIVPSATDEVTSRAASDVPADTLSRLKSRCLHQGETVDSEGFDGIVVHLPTLFGRRNQKGAWQIWYRHGFGGLVVQVGQWRLRTDSRYLCEPSAGPVSSKLYEQTVGLSK